ncbi:hypothetical protein SK68_04214 [Serratia marcescens]|nr:hypothetical protein SK68_04214 [Serratia marcescens]KMJ08666.1 hypothetical protein SN03_04086 [Serratia marcescens]
MVRQKCSGIRRSYLGTTSLAGPISLGLAFSFMGTPIFFSALISITYSRYPF